MTAAPPAAAGCWLWVLQPQAWQQAGSVALGVLALQQCPLLASLQETQKKGC